MSSTIEKIYDVPVHRNWFRITLIKNSETIKAFLDNECKGILPIMLGGGSISLGPTDKDLFEFTLESDKFKVKMGNEKIEKYMESHSSMFSTWEVKVDGVTTKVVTEKEEPVSITFRGQKVEKPRKGHIMSGQKLEWNFKNHTFKIEHRFEREGWTNTLFMDGRVIQPFVPAMGK